MDSELQSVKLEFHRHVKQLQDEIIAALKERDPKLKVTQDLWERKDYDDNPGGGGVTCALEGEVLENAGVNTSLIHGRVDPQFAKKVGGGADEIWATGISLILHPYNPRVPTVHANFRMIHSGSKYWFGGGADLTPYYPYEEDFQHFHQTWKQACEGVADYAQMKHECDRYFVNHHRQAEMRGIGGIFFDHYNSGDLQKDFAMVVHLSKHFLSSYLPILDRRREESWEAEDEAFQLYRRGRYVEFNLLHDRGTMFGLKSRGRTESILISLPKRCQFHYQFPLTSDSPQAKMQDYYRPMNWV